MENVITTDAFQGSLRHFSTARRYGPSYVTTAGYLFRWRRDGWPVPNHRVFVLLAFWVRVLSSFPCLVQHCLNASICQNEGTQRPSARRRDGRGASRDLPPSCTAASPSSQSSSPSVARSRLPAPASALPPTRTPRRPRMATAGAGAPAHPVLKIRLSLRSGRARRQSTGPGGGSGRGTWSLPLIRLVVHRRVRRPLIGILALRHPVFLFGLRAGQQTAANSCAVMGGIAPLAPWPQDVEGAESEPG